MQGIDRTHTQDVIQKLTEYIFQRKSKGLITHFFKTFNDYYKTVLNESEIPNEFNKMMIEWESLNFEKLSYPPHKELDLEKKFHNSVIDYLRRMIAYIWDKVDVDQNGLIEQKEMVMRTLCGVQYPFQFLDTALIKYDYNGIETLTYARLEDYVLFHFYVQVFKVYDLVIYI